MRQIEAVQQHSDLELSWILTSIDSDVIAVDVQILKCKPGDRADHCSYVTTSQRAADCGGDVHDVMKERDFGGVAATVLL